MKAQLPHMDDFRLEVPAHMMWMKKGHCPALMEAWDIEKIRKRMASVFKNYENDDWSAFGWRFKQDLDLNLRAQSTPTKTVHDEILDPHHVGLSIDFYDGSSSNVGEEYDKGKNRTARFLINEDLFIFPYMFKVVEANVIQFDSERFCWLPDEPRVKQRLIVDVPQHWDKLASLELLSKDAMTRCGGDNIVFLSS